MEPTSPLLRVRLVRVYERYLQTCCGVTQGTRALFTWHVHRFLIERFRGRRIDLASLRPPDVIRYITNLSPRYAPNTQKSAVSALRSFLRWACMRGRCDQRVIDAVPTVSSRKWSELPRHLSAEDLNALLGGFDRSTPAGKRGYAAALCMVRLGLRIGEVARIQLGDIDWRLGTLRLPTRKCHRGNVLPLPREVGISLVDYLRTGRPRSSSRQLFVCFRPAGKPAGRDALRSEIYRAYQRARLRSTGTHALRHTAATQLIQKGATIKEIADVLGHRSIDSTGIYAKVNIPQLKEVALRWPEVPR